MLTAAGIIFNASAMNDGHELTSLWDQYEKARKADRPQKEAEILADIKAQALKKHLPVDFYDAATEYVRTVQRRDWKQADKLREDLEKEVKQYDDALVTFLWMGEWKGESAKVLWDYVQAHPGDFKGCHPSLHRGVSSMLNGAYCEFISSDAEYVLWYVLTRSTSLKGEVAASLRPLLAGSYPGEGTLEYVFANKKDKAEMERLAGKYAGKALALFPESQLLGMEMKKLDEIGAGQDKYRALGDKCHEFEKRRQAFGGGEAVIAKAVTSVSSLLDRLEDKSLDVEVEDNTIKVIFRNLSQANVTLRRDKETVRTWKAVNTACSYYIKDTVEIPMGALPDGSYTIEAVSGKLSAEESVQQYTLSIATRIDSRGRSVFVADYKTGEPLKNVTLRLLKSGKELAVSTLALDGFTKLPDAIEKQIADGGNAYFKLEAVSGDRLSLPVSIDRAFYVRTADTSVKCNIYKDRGAYNPGDTMQFKAIVFQGDAMLGMNVCKGRTVKLRFRDSEGNILETRSLKTNDWGAVSGSFVIPSGLRNGMFRIEVEDLARDSFRVDEFVLPSFTLDFDPVEKLYLPGDEITVSGSVTSYSGHSLSSARLEAVVERYGNEEASKEVILDTDNKFSFTFPVLYSGYYYVTVKLTDASGETLSFSHGYYVGNNLGIETHIENTVESEVSLMPEDEDSPRWSRKAASLVQDSHLKVLLQATDADYNPVPIPVGYTLTGPDGAVVASGSLPSGESLSANLPASGIYVLKTFVSAKKADGSVVSSDKEDRILYLAPSEKAVPVGVSTVFVPGETEVSGKISARMGSGEGKIYAAVTLYGEGRKVLYSAMKLVDKGKIADITLPYLDSYPDAVRLQVFYFINGDSVRYDELYRRAKDKYTLPLKFTRFTDKAFPGTEYTFELKTAPGVEALAAVWDKSLDAVAANYWPQVTLRDYSVEGVSINITCGRIGTQEPMPFYRLEARAKGAVLESVNASMDAAAPAMALVEEVTDDSKAAAPDEGVKARADFSTALTFQPHLYPSAEGKLKFSFRTSDKLSTYYVRVYAHDEAMRNAMVQDEMVVSIPVKVTLLEPRFLYVGDRYDAVVTVSSIASEPVSGTIVLRAGEFVQQVPVTVGVGEVISRTFTVRADASMCDGKGILLLKASFVADDFTDAVQVEVPVMPAAQALTEAHSAVLRDGMSREALLGELRSRFVNVPASSAVLRDISVLDMVKDAIPSHIEPSANDVLSLSEAWYIGLMASRLNTAEGVSPEVADNGAEAPSGNTPSASLLQKIMACQNADGGFAWFEGMPSNAIITAVLLERFAKLRDRGFEVPDVSESVKYLDTVQFGTSLQYWCGWVSDAQYMRVRALYASVPFEVKPVSDTGKKRMKEFKNSAKAYLVPSKKDGRGLEGQILAKARRLLTLRSLLSSGEGIALAKAWGVKLGTSARLKKSMRADITSLVEYAVEHRDGGWYYPNAVMPWRGLLESEAYAHALLCELLDNAEVTEGSPSAIADGIRLWLMLQKETQKWDTEPAYIDAITAILDGSEAVLNTRVLALSASYEAPFKDVKASGNGFTVERKFFRDGEEIKPGEEVSVGDRISAKYIIWNTENRSFVKVTAGHEASLQPVQQLSGHLGFGFIRPFDGRVSRWVFTPYGYRNVKASVTEYYFDSYPEENTVLEEEFFVVRAGSFQAPVTVIESLYASHYRANSAYMEPLQSSVK